MTSSLRAGVIAVVAIAIGIGLSGCGSDTKAEPSTSKQTSTESSADDMTILIPRAEGAADRDRRSRSDR